MWLAALDILCAKTLKSFQYSTSEISATAIKCAHLMCTHFSLKLTVMMLCETLRCRRSPTYFSWAKFAVSKRPLQNLNDHFLRVLQSFPWKMPEETVEQEQENTKATIEIAVTAQTQPIPDHRKWCGTMNRIDTSVLLLVILTRAHHLCFQYHSVPKAQQYGETFIYNMQYMYFRRHISRAIVFL